MIHFCDCKACDLKLITNPFPPAHMIFVGGRGHGKTGAQATLVEHWFRGYDWAAER